VLECIEDGKVLSIAYEQVERLYYQNPAFGFYFLRLATARLFDTIAGLEPSSPTATQPCNRTWPWPDLDCFTTLRLRSIGSEGG
jgi:hypothetical protein